MHAPARAGPARHSVSRSSRPSASAVPRAVSLRGECLAIVGLGQSGKAAAELAVSLGARVLALDLRPPSDPFPPPPLSSSIELHIGPHDVALLSKCSGLVLSPGVPLDQPLVHEAKVRVRDTPAGTHLDRTHISKLRRYKGHLYHRSL